MQVDAFLKEHEVYDFHPRRCIDGPVVDRFRRKGMLEFRQDCRWNENSPV
jgi:hypothetical protein